MDEVKRYSEWAGRWSKGDIELHEHPFGAWVKYEDYASAEERARDAEFVRDADRAEIVRLRSEWANAEARCVRWALVAGWARHDTDCRVHEYGDCTCGLAEAKTAAPAPGAEAGKGEQR